MSKSVGIYNIYGIEGESRVVINHRETVCPKEEETINDVLLDDYHIIENVQGKIYACNLTDSFLLSTKKLPVFYINVIYERPLVCVLLYKVYLLFEITCDIKSAEELIGSPIEGKFTVDVVINDMAQTIDDNITSFAGTENTCQKLINFTCVDEMKELIGIMIKEIQDKNNKKYENENFNFDIPENVISLKDYDVGDE